MREYFGRPRSARPTPTGGGHPDDADGAGSDRSGVNEAQTDGPGGPAERSAAADDEGGGLGLAEELTPTVWTGRATNRFQWLAAVAGAACMALGITIAVESAWTSGVLALLMAVIGCVAAGALVLFGTLAFVHVAVKVDDRAMEVRCGHIGVPRRRILLSHVVGAEFAPRVTPRQWGGWGYRWRPEKGTAVVVRRGEGLILRLGDGRTFTVTVDDAEAAVRVIRDHLRPPPPPTPPAPTGV